MSSFFDDQTIEIPCPGCGHKTAKTIGWLKTNSEYTCVCGSTINLQSDEFRSGIAEAERSIEELKRTLKKL